MQPDISVVIATYNWSSVLKYAIHSVLWQEFKNFEILVVGDGCTDNSEQLVRSFKDERIRWYNLPTNTGSQSIPNNKGIELARGKYIAYLGHDDIWCPNHLRVLLPAIEKADLAHTLLLSIGPSTKAYAGRLEITGFGKNIFVPPSSTIHKKGVCGLWKDYKEISVPPDHEFLSRFYINNKTIVLVKELTVFKFNSAWRKNSYKEKPYEEQRLCYYELANNRMKFISDKLCEATARYGVKFVSYEDGIRNLEKFFAEYPEHTLPIITKSDKKPGEWVEEIRKYRGL